MNAITTTEDHQVNAQTLEDVLANGDLSKLTADQRVAYYFQVCKSLGLNPYTRPFDYITLNGKRVLYAKRDCTDQLRQIRGITLAVTDKHIEDDLFIVTVRATDAKGRSDEDFGAVPIANLKGELRANAILKGITKAKRRVTLSICGMGMNDESEVATIPGAVTEHLELPPPDLRQAINAEIPLKAAAATAPQGERVVGDTDYGTVEDQAPKPKRTGEQWNVWVDKLEKACAVYRTRSELDEVVWRPAFIAAKKEAPSNVLRDIDSILAAAYERLPAEPIENDPLLSGDLADIEISGADKVASG